MAFEDFLDAKRVLSVVERLAPTSGAEVMGKMIGVMPKANQYKTAPGSTGFLFLVNSHSTPRSLARDRHGERNGIDQERGSREPRRGGVATLSESPERRVWLFLDEFPQLPPIKQFPTFLELGRSKGIAVVIGAQEDAHQCQRGSGGHQPADWRPGDRAAHPKRHPLRRTCQRHGKR